MRVPTSLSLTCRPVRPPRTHRLTLTSLVGFSLAEGASRLIPETLGRGMVGKGPADRVAAVEHASTRAG